MDNKVNGELNLVDYIKVIQKRRVTIVLIILIGIVVSFSMPRKPVTYQAVGHYKVKRLKKVKQFVAEAKVRHPGIKISNDSGIIKITTTDSTPESAREEQASVAKSLKIKKIIPIQNYDTINKAFDDLKKKRVMVLMIFIFVGILIGFIKEGWENNKKKL